MDRKQKSVRKKIIMVGGALAAFYMVLWGVSRSDWHLKRNRNNTLPEGRLLKVKDSLYIDEKGTGWILQPHRMNVFHQPDSVPVSAIPKPYPDMNPPPDFDPYHPNLKFLSPDERGGSREAILQPDGSFLVIGSKQGTYNYAHPAGFFGMVKHTLLDVIPHFFSSDYDERLNRSVR